VLGSGACSCVLVALCSNMISLTVRCVSFVCAVSLHMHATLLLDCTRLLSNDHGGCDDYSVSIEFDVTLMSSRLH
jgi:hypothetical protein